ncbi:hypothetical protein [Allochromatium tepidum]|uniref:Uncharacterized protein n=1 Tax=Allochromatium tepidum TaxID=553982 RepID=A0ABM7QP17_9GAMM|nr:hypothetical protein [Allochromatium tepidum]BCU07608.1 hypothetical protein Atep_22850 [Allochromatium tepidum]
MPLLNWRTLTASVRGAAHECSCLPNKDAARNYGTLLRDGGEPAVQPHLTEWLNEASRLGSGDDVSLGLLWQTA